MTKLQKKQQSAMKQIVEIALSDANKREILCALTDVLNVTKEMIKATK